MRKDKEKKMAEVRYCCQTNSTLFSTCCGSAVTDKEDKCPSCGEKIWPESARSRHDIAMRSLYGNDMVNKMRKEWERKYSE